MGEIKIVLNIIAFHSNWNIVESIRGSRPFNFQSIFSFLNGSGKIVWIFREKYIRNHSEPCSIDCDYHLFISTQHLLACTQGLLSSSQCIAYKGCSCVYLFFWFFLRILLVCIFPAGIWYVIYKLGLFVLSMLRGLRKRYNNIVKKLDLCWKTTQK